MTTELVPSIPGRPATYRENGCVVYIGIRDAEYIRVNREWRQKLANAHPDRQERHGCKRFRVAMHRYTWWKIQQRKEYWALGQLMPPDWRGAPKPPLNTIYHAPLTLMWKQEQEQV